MLRRETKEIQESLLLLLLPLLLLLLLLLPLLLHSKNIHSKLDNLAFTLPIDLHDSGADVQPTVAQFNAFTAHSEGNV